MVCQWLHFRAGISPLFPFKRSCCRANMLNWTLLNDMTPSKEKRHMFETFVKLVHQPQRLQQKPALLLFSYVSCFCPWEVFTSMTQINHRVWLISFFVFKSPKRKNSYYKSNLDVNFANIFFFNRNVFITSPQCPEGSAISTMRTTCVSNIKWNFTLLCIHMFDCTHFKNLQDHVFSSLRWQIPFYCLTEFFQSRFQMAELFIVRLFFFSFKKQVVDITA